MKYYKYISDQNYISDLNPNDLGDSDVSAISDVEVENNDIDFAYPTQRFYSKNIEGKPGSKPSAT